MDQTNFGVQKKILHAGRTPEGGAMPLSYPKETKFYFHYQIRKTLGDEAVIDDTRKYGKMMELYSGKEFQIQVWELCLETMAVNEVSAFTVEAHHLTNFPAVNKKLRDFMLNKHEHGTAKHCCGMMAMKEQGGLGYSDLDQLMETSQPLEFTFELVKVDLPGDSRKEAWIMSTEEKTKLLPTLREEGNNLYRSGDLPGAVTKYGEALAILEQLILREKPGDEEWNELNTTKVPYLLNLAQCRLALKEYYLVIGHTKDVLELDPSNVKALYRRGKAHMAVWNMKEAQDDLKKAAELDPSLSNTVAKELAEIDRLLKEKNLEDKQAFGGIFA